MKHLLLTTIAAVVLVGCGESQHVKDAKLARAASQGKIKEVKKYLAAGANVDARRALHEAVDRGHKEVVELLIATSADVNAKNQWGRTPLHQAAVRGRKEIVELLLANGADVNAKGDSGGAPLLSARTVEIAELLIANGADVNAKNDDHQTINQRRCGCECEGWDWKDPFALGGLGRSQGNRRTAYYSRFGCEREGWGWRYTAR